MQGIILLLFIIHFRDKDRNSDNNSNDCSERERNTIANNHRVLMIIAGVKIDFVLPLIMKLVMVTAYT